MKYKNISIVPHGVLHFIPFQALVLTTGEFLGQKLVLNNLPSASIYMTLKNKNKINKKNFLGMAIGNMYLGNFMGLPGTIEEVKTISAEYTESNTLMEYESTETNFKINAPSFSRIHLATHGFFNEENPLYSFMLFNQTEEDDGLLEVHEIFGLDLRAEMIVLSACQTGLGKISRGDDIIGLSRAFLFAGTPRVVVSLWNVADESTAYLMIRFNKYLKTHSAANALHLAQHDAMHKYPDPFYWAPFILIGVDS